MFCTGSSCGRKEHGRNGVGKEGDEDRRTALLLAGRPISEELVEAITIPNAVEMVGEGFCFLLQHFTGKAGQPVMSTANVLVGIIGTPVSKGGYPVFSGVTFSLWLFQRLEVSIMR